MDLFLKKLHLKNFCYYEEHTFDFLKPDGTPYPFVCFVGPNGCGKTSALEAISLLTMNRFGRGIDRIRQSLSKYVHNEDYNPFYKESKSADPIMLIEGLFSMNGQDYVIKMNEHGWIQNDFAPVSDLTQPTTEDMSLAARSGPWGDDYLRYLQRISHFVSSDSDLSMNNFQLVRSYSKDFETIMETIMRYPTKCLMPMDLGTRSENQMYCTDFVIQKTKKNGKQINTHFKRMSAGEKKITKSFSDLMNLMHSLANPASHVKPMVDWPRILLIDNVEMHAYYDRHVKMVDELKRVFSNQQIFSTTHSGVLIERAKNKQNDVDTELFIDIEPINS